MKQKLLEAAGWYGTFAIIGAYALSSFSIIQSHSFTYQFLNLTGALGIISISLYKKVYQSVVLNVIWTLIAISALVKLFI
jgi:hypothetical protein